MKKVVGFDQKILLHQLDFIVREMPRTEKKDELYDKVGEFLTADIGGERSRTQARTIIFKIWYLVNDEHKELQKQAIELFDKVTSEERVVLHWGLTILAYPFFRDVVNEMGVLFKLQDEVSSDQISRKVKALYGDRRRVEVSVSAVLTSLRSWGVVVSEKRNMQRSAIKTAICTPELKDWLAEVLIHALGANVIPIEQFRNHPILFPFKLEISSDELNKERFIVIRQGVDMRMVGLCK